MSHALFSPFHMGDLNLSNRIVMAPLTRNRATIDGDTTHQLHAAYYSQRAGAGLIISEGTQISAEGKGYFRTPGIYTEAQVAAWKQVTKAVHDKGGLIFCQLWHVGRISHTKLQPDGQPPVAPSAIKADAKTFIEEGFVDVSQPRALETSEIPRLIEDYRHAAQCARDAGFDGVELHAANGYLLDQFMREGSNKRDDAYGGSVENRTRIIKDVLDALTSVWDGSRIGIRFSPYSHAGDAQIDDPTETYLSAIRHANDAGLAYMHMIEGETGGERTMNAVQIRTFRDAFTGAYMANNGYDRQMAMDAVDDGVDLVCFGRAYIANPDLAERLEVDGPLNTANPKAFYGGGAEGYTDYPAMDRSKAA